MGRDTFVLVHGAWHQAACWGRVARALADAGHRVIAPDLPGNGLDARYPSSYLTGDRARLETEASPLADVGLETWADAVADGVRTYAPQARSDGGRLVLVAHSLGGLAVTRAAEQAADSIDHLVYVTAHCATRLPSGVAYFALPENASALVSAVQVGDPATTGAVRINPRHPDAAYLDLLRAGFYGDVPEEEFWPFLHALSPDLPARVVLDDARGTPERWGRVPRTFVRCSEDRAFPLPLQDLMIREADEATPGNPFHVETLRSSHSPFASRPRELAAVLTSLPRTA
jgi:pimeloyl-ACP methyl ester carboxylesterase